MSHLAENDVLSFVRPVKLENERDIRLFFRLESAERWLMSVPEVPFLARLSDVVELSVLPPAPHVEHPDEMPGRFRVETATPPEFSFGNRGMLEFDGNDASVKNIRSVFHAVRFKNEFPFILGKERLPPEMPRRHLVGERIAILFAYMGVVRHALRSGAESHGGFANRTGIRRARQLGGDIRRHAFSETVVRENHDRGSLLSRFASEQPIDLSGDIHPSVFLVDGRIETVSMTLAGPEPPDGVLLQRLGIVPKVLPLVFDHKQPSVVQLADKVRIEPTGWDRKSKGLVVVRQVA